MIAVAKILGPVGFGELNILQITFNSFGTVASFGLGLASTKFIAESNKIGFGKASELGTYFLWTSVLISLFLSILFLAVSEPFSEHFLNSAQLGPLLRIGIPYFIFSTINNVQIGILGGFQDFRAVAFLQVTAGICSVFLGLGGAMWSGIKGCLWGYNVAFLILCVISQRSIRRHDAVTKVPVSISGLKREVRAAGGFIFYATLSSFWGVMANWGVSTYLVSQIRGFHDFGVYQACMRVKQIPETILNSILSPLLPALAENVEKKNFFEFESFMKMGFCISSLVIIPITYLQMAAPEVILQIFGNEFQGDYSVVWWLMIHSLTIGMFFPFGALLASRDKMKLAFQYNAFQAGFLVLLGAVLIPRFGGVGLAATTALVQWISSFCFLAYVQRKVPSLVVESRIIRKAILVLLRALIIIYVKMALSKSVAVFLALVFLLELSFREWNNLKRLRNFSLNERRQAGKYDE